ncbi:MAG: hypothetical protein WBZ01_14755 [Terriglobales bacterium]
MVGSFGEKSSLTKGKPSALETELKNAVSDQAHGRGYGPPDEIVRAESPA